MRLIDADYLKQMFDVACGTNREVFNIADSVYKFAIKTIDDAPTVITNSVYEAYCVLSDEEFEHSDSFWITTPKGKKINFVKERPQGEWLENSGNIACSHCHTIWLYRRTDFCPNCGADMRGGRE